MDVVFRPTLTQALSALALSALLCALVSCAQPPREPEPALEPVAEASSDEAPTQAEQGSPQAEQGSPQAEQAPNGAEPETATLGAVTTGAASADVVESVAAEAPETTPEGAGETPPTAEKGVEAPPATTRPSEDTLGPECAGTLAEIRERETRVPTVFYGISRPAEEIEADVQRLVELCPKFLADCGGTRADGFVGATYARMLMSLDARYQSSLRDAGLSSDLVRESMRTRRSEVIAVAEKAIQDSAAESMEWYTAHRMIQEAQLRLGRYPDVREPTDLMLKESAPYLVRTGAVEAITRSYMAERRYDEAVKFLYRVTDKYSEDPEYVVYNIRLHEALNGAGDLLGIEELMHQIRAEYPSRIERTYPEGPMAKAQDLLRSQYEQWYWCQSLFWLGFARMALGDMRGAEGFFEENIAEVASRAAQLKIEGKTIDNVCEIIVQYRTQHLLEFLRTKYGNVPEGDFDGLLWATERKITLKEARDAKKAVAIVMRRPGDVRSETFLTEIDRFVRDRAEDGAAGIWLSFLTGRGGAEEDERAIQAMKTDLGGLGVTMPAGYDPDRKAQNVVRELYGTVGTASFAVIDRQGRLAWWMADTRDMDRNIAIRVLERILREE